MKLKENTLLLVTLILVVILSLVALFAGRQIEDLQRKNTGEALKTVLQTVHRGVLIWSDEKLNAVKQASKAEALQNITLELLELQRQGNLHMSTAINASLQSWFFSRLEAPEIIDYEIVSTDLITLYSTHEDEIGKPNDLLEDHPLTALIKSGQTIISTPNRARANPDNVILFGATPIRDSRAKIVAYLLAHFAPDESLEPIFIQGRIQGTGETYAFNREGVILTASRFSEQLMAAGYADDEASSYPHFKLLNPGFDITEGGRNREKLVSDKLPFTFSVQEALAGRNGYSVDGYLDYRGIPVIGAWLWDESLNLGIASEIDVSEAYADIYRARKLTMLITLTGMSLLLILFSVYYHSRRQLQSISSELQIQEERLSLALEATNDGLWDWHIGADQAYFSPRFMELLGLPATKGTQTMNILLERLHPSDKPHLIDKIVSEANKSATFQIITRIDVKDKGYRWFETRGKSVRHTGEQGTQRIVGMISDIHDQVNATEQLQLLNEQLEKQVAERTDALRKSNQELSLILENTAEGILGIDAEGKITFANQAAVNMTGYESTELTGASQHELLCHHLANGQTYPNQESSIFQAIHSGQTLSAQDEVFWTKSGRVLPVEYTVTPVTRVQDIAGAVVVFRDITARKQIEQAQQQAIEAAETANRSKSQFLANMSHEIRTPMNAIIGMTQLCLNDSLSDRQRQYLNNVKTASRSLLNVINDILDFSKIEAGKLRLEASPFTLQELLEEMSSVISFKAYEKGVRFLVELSPNIPPILIGDSMRLNQILINLCANAVKFTEKGEIVLKIHGSAQNHAGLILSFQIRDSGIGMSEEQQAVVFDAFAQADGTTTRRFGGTGLGLSICKRLVHLMEGEISVSSRLGRGSLFQFSVQLGLTTQTAIEIPRLPITNVAIFSTHEATRQNITHWLALLGITSTHRPPEQTLPSHNDCDLVILDAIDRESAQRHMALATALTTEKMPVVWLVGPDQASLPGTISTAIVLPVLSLSQFAQGLAEAIKYDTSATEPLAGETTPYAFDTPPNESIESQTALKAPEMLCLNLTGRRVLLVEDNRLNQELACALLEDTGATISVAENGAKAVEWLEANDVDVVLMDVQMPVMDGFSATRALRKIPRHKTTPVIAMTANARPSDRADCLGSGMDDYLSKPIDPDALFAKLDLWVNHTANTQDAS
ncbi:MAG: response regulator [Hahellaceae bacterium]|nr:response regulator [Hahellaceae bacterium]MCP5169385.1 response regulator [Hahellaceae bacterium]